MAVPYTHKPKSITDDEYDNELIIDHPFLKPTEKLQYEKFNETELLTFAQRRGLLRCLVELGPDYRKWAKEFCIHLLEFADARPSFERFLDLPPEIRTIVYQMVCDMGSSVKDARIPAVCRASTQLRSESLPIFFSQNRFLFVAELASKSGNTWSDMDHRDHAWLRRYKNHIYMVRKLSLALAWVPWGSCRQLCTVHIDLSNDAKDATILPVTIRTGGLRPRHEQVEGHLPGFKAEVNSRLASTHYNHAELVKEIIDIFISCCNSIEYDANRTYPQRMFQLDEVFTEMS